MKYCLSSRQTAEYLQKADEIKIEYRDRNIIEELAEKYPKAGLTLEVHPDTQIDFDELKQLNILSKNNLTVCFPKITTEVTAFCTKENIPFFLGYKISTPYELRAIEKTGAAEARIDAPLFFNAEALQNADVKIRVFANMAHDNFLPYGDGINGAWIRPEDIELYENVIDTVEFVADTLEQEQALYRIYAEKHQWSGKLNQIIKNLEIEVNNTFLPAHFGERRLTCSQRCTEEKCHLCYSYFHLANPDRIASIKL